MFIDVFVRDMVSIDKHSQTKAFVQIGFLKYHAIPKESTSLATNGSAGIAK